MAPRTADTRCAAIGAKLRLRLSPLKVKHKPDDAPTHFIAPTLIKSILNSGPVEQLLFCACDTCQKYSLLSADGRKRRFQNFKLDDKYFTLFALLLTENCTGLIWEFYKRDIILDRPIYKTQLDFLTDLLSDHCTSEEIIDTENRIIQNQFRFFAKPLDTGTIDKEYDSKEALPIEDDERPVGKGGFGEVYAFKIFEEYKGAGYRNFEVM